MPKRSAGLIMYRTQGCCLEVLLVHPGGPFWANKDAGAWSIPKGEIEAAEQPLESARREFYEETGFPANAPFVELGEVRQNGRKVVLAWAFAGDCDPTQLRSILCEIEWPPRSGRMLQFPEIDRGAWFSIEAARRKIVIGQTALLDNLCAALAI